MADPLAILDRFEAYEAINDATSAQAGSSDRDAEVIDIWVAALSRRIDELCGPVVVRTVTDERHDGGRSRIWLDNAPVSSITTLVEYDVGTVQTLTAEQDDNLPEDGYLLDDDGSVIRRNGGGDALFPPGRRNVKATYEAGRAADTASVDAKFKMAAGAILRRLWQREAGAWARATDPFTEVGGGPAFFKAVDPMVHEFLSDEMRVPVAI